MTDERNDFEYPFPLHATLYPLARTLSPEMRVEIAQVIALLTDRDRALEDYLSSYVDLTVQGMLKQGGAGVLYIPANTVRGRRSGTEAHVHANMLVQTSFAMAGNPIQFTLPVGWEVAGTAAVSRLVGIAHVGSAGVNYTANAFATTARNIQLIQDGSNNWVGVVPNLNIVAGDGIYLNLHYELA